MSDKFKLSYIDKSTSLDFYCKYVRHSGHSKNRRKTKKMLHRIGRSRMKQDLTKELKEEQF